MTDPVEPAPIGGDNPIRSSGEDLLDRADFAKVIARQIRRVDATQGAVVGVLGPWGVGKSSLLAMIVEQLRATPPLAVVQFNPWLVSGTNQLVSFFLAELGSQLEQEQSRSEQLRERAAKLAERLDAYAKALSPLRFIPGVGGALESVSDAAGGVKELLSPDKSISAQRDAITELLDGLDFPVVIVVDDVDRLQPAEVRDVLRLVRLTGQFPNLIYLLAFDRRYVEQALSEAGFDGKAYLEKILQLAFDVPPPPQPALQQLLTHGMDAAVAASPAVGPWHEDRWPDALVEVVLPLFRHLRDVKRYLATLPAALEVLGDEVALVDVLALEAIRVQLPAAHASLPNAAAALTTTRSSGTNSSAGPPPPLQALLAAAGDEHEETLRSAVRLLFPAAGHHLGHGGGLMNPIYGESWLPAWRRERRVAHPNVLSYYLDRTLMPGTARTQQIQEIFDALHDPARAGELLSALNSDVLEDALDRLLPYVPDVPMDAIEAAITAFLETLPRLRTGSRGMFDFGADLHVTRLVLRLLERLPELEERARLITRVIPALTTLRAQFELLDVAGHREGAGHGLIEPGDAERLEEELAARIRAAPVDQLAKERDLASLLYHGLRLDASSDAIGELPALQSPNVVTALLRDAYRPSYGQTVGSRYTRAIDRLQWDLLLTLYGGPETLQTAVATARAQVADEARDERTRQALATFDRYVEGWRP